MTEYEIADLAASSAFKLQGQVSLFQTSITMMTDVVQQFMGLLFGFIIAAHFIGASLGRRQVYIFTMLYVLWQIWMISVIASRGYLARLILERLAENGDPGTDALSITPILTATSLSLLVAALSASLYYMWCVRHPRTG